MNEHSAFLDPHSEIDKHGTTIPHWQQGNTFVFVTWRLADGLPESVLSEWKEEKRAWLAVHPKPWDRRTERDYQERFYQKAEEWMDQGAGSCVLKDPEVANIVARALRHFDGIRYDLSAFVVMPNHVHVLFQPLRGCRLFDIIKVWKGFTARTINAHLKISGTLWQDAYWDRLIRSEEHLMKCRKYIRRNPSQAHLRDGEFLTYER